MSWWPFGKVAASADYQRWFDATKVERPASTRRWLDDLFKRYTFAPSAKAWLDEIEVEIGQLPPAGSKPIIDTGYPLSDADVRYRPQSRRLMLLTARDDAAIHGLTLAWWHTKLDHEATPTTFTAVLHKLAAEEAAKYAFTSTLAAHAVHGIQSAAFQQPGVVFRSNGSKDPAAAYAALATSIMGDMALLPDYAAACYDGLFTR